MKLNQELLNPRSDFDQIKFSNLVIELVGQIPQGRLMTYGQIAALAGSPMAARIVGGIAHYANPELPWHRVVNKQGYLASGYPGGRIAQKKALEKEGVVVSKKFKVSIEKLIWWPSI